MRLRLDETNINVIKIGILGAKTNFKMWARSSSGSSPKSGKVDKDIFYSAELMTKMFELVALA